MSLPAEQLGPGSLRQAALLIDADNFSDVPSLHEAWLQFKSRAGRVSICRAYGGAARLQTLSAVWHSLAARCMPNLSLEKNTTDAALVADAVALHFQQGVRLFAIASGDADFAPLAVRLREWGCEVWCFSMEGIVFAGAEYFYDRVIRFAPAPTVPMTSPEPVRLAPAPLVPITSPVPDLPEDVVRILKAVPSLHQAPQKLSVVVPVLRQNAIFPKTTKSTTFFARYADYFKLSPVQQPVELSFLLQRAAALAPAPQAPPVPPLQKHVLPLQKPVLPLQKPALLPPGCAVLSWAVNGSRRATPPLLAELHGLRLVLIKLALRRLVVADVLLAAPELLSGQACALSSVAGRLREKNLLHPSQSSLRIFEQYPKTFAVDMHRVPQTVAYMR